MAGQVSSKINTACLPANLEKHVLHCLLLLRTATASEQVLTLKETITKSTARKQGEKMGIKLLFSQSKYIYFLQPTHSEEEPGFLHEVQRMKVAELSSKYQRPSGLITFVTTWLETSVCSWKVIEALNRAFHLQSIA